MYSQIFRFKAKPVERSCILERPPTNEPDPHPVYIYTNVYFMAMCVQCTLASGVLLATSCGSICDAAFALSSWVPLAEVAVEDCAQNHSSILPWDHDIGRNEAHTIITYPCPPCSSSCAPLSSGQLGSPDQSMPQFHNQSRTSGKCHWKLWQRNVRTCHERRWGFLVNLDLET